MSKEVGSRKTGVASPSGRGTGSDGFYCGQSKVAARIAGFILLSSSMPFTGQLVSGGMPNKSFVAQGRLKQSFI